MVGIGFVDAVHADDQGNLLINNQAFKRIELETQIGGRVGRGGID